MDDIERHEYPPWLIITIVEEVVNATCIYMCCFYSSESKENRAKKRQGKRMLIFSLELIFCFQKINEEEEEKRKLQTKRINRLLVHIHDKREQKKTNTLRLINSSRHKRGN